jgi:hypothetical protein
MIPIHAATAVRVVASMTPPGTSFTGTHGNVSARSAVHPLLCRKRVQRAFGLKCKINQLFGDYAILSESFTVHTTLAPTWVGGGGWVPVQMGGRRRLQS